jgi:hypothetical protein
MKLQRTRSTGLPCDRFRAQAACNGFEGQLWCGGSMESVIQKWRIFCKNNHNHGRGALGVPLTTATTPPAPLPPTPLIAAPRASLSPITFKTSNVFAFKTTSPIAGVGSSNLRGSPALASPSMRSISSLSSVSSSSGLRTPFTTPRKVLPSVNDEEAMLAAMSTLELQVPVLSLQDVLRKYWWITGHVFHTPCVQFNI